MLQSQVQPHKYPPSLLFDIERFISSKLNNILANSCKSAHMLCALFFYEVWLWSMPNIITIRYYLLITSHIDYTMWKITFKWLTSTTCHSKNSATNSSCKVNVEKFLKTSNPNLLHSYMYYRWFCVIVKFHRAWWTMMTFFLMFSLGHPPSKLG